MPPLVIDCSMVMSWCFEDEKTIQTKNILNIAKNSQILVPALWQYEVVNTLSVAERKARITIAESIQFLDMLYQLLPVIDQSNDHKYSSQLLLLASKSKLSAYDAAYLELALRNSCPLATLDKQLQQAAQQMGVKLLLD